jgi:hypothetical protein
MFIESAGEGLRADREHALRCAAYQTLTHRSDKRVARWIGMPARSVAHVNGPSTRVGAAQDLAELDIDLAAITEAAAWKSTRMPLQYAERSKPCDRATRERQRMRGGIRSAIERLGQRGPSCRLNVAR